MEETRAHLLMKTVQIMKYFNVLFILFLHTVADEEEIDLRGYSIVGCSPMMLQLIVLPPQPKSVNNWIITQNTMDSLIESPPLTEPSGAPSVISARMKYIVTQYTY